MWGNGPLGLPKRGGNKPEYQEKTPDNQSENRYRILDVKIHRLNHRTHPRFHRLWSKKKKEEEEEEEEESIKTPKTKQ